MDAFAKSYAFDLIVSYSNYLLMRSQVSKDGDSFKVPLAVAKMSELVKSMMDGKFCSGNRLCLSKPNSVDDI